MLTHDTLVEGERPPLVQIQLLGSFSRGGYPCEYYQHHSNSAQVIYTLLQAESDSSPKCFVVHIPYKVVEM